MEHIKWSTKKPNDLVLSDSMLGLVVVRHKVSASI